MKDRIRRLTLILVIVFLLILINSSFSKKEQIKAFTIPNLPRPIAKTPVAITCAGQSPDVYIIHDILDQLLLRNFFVPQAETIAYLDVESVVFVLGHSSLECNLRLSKQTDEKQRIEKLLKEVEDNDLTLIMIALGNEYSSNEETLEYIELIGEHADYIIGLKGSSYEKALAVIAKDKDIHLSIVNEVSELFSPFASAFR